MWMSLFIQTQTCLIRRRQWRPTPVLLPGKSHGRRRLVCCTPWGRQESDTTERLHFHFSLSRIGEENGNPLQCSCLENPRDEGDWWAAVSGVTQSKCHIILVTIVSDASSPITSWQIDGETMETVTDVIFLGFKVTADGGCSHEIKRRLLLGRKAMTNLDSILKHRDITLPTKVHIVKAMFFSQQSCMDVRVGP